MTVIGSVTGSTGTSAIGGTYGLSGSGIDVDSLVKKLMAGEQAKEDALVQKKTVLEWQKAAYNTVYDDLSNFRNTVFNYKLQATLSPNKVSSSNTSVATATANADAADVSHSLTVTQLADGVKLTSSSNITAANATKDTIANQFYGGSSGVPADPIQIKIANGTLNATFTVNPSGSIYDFISQINNAGINVKASYDSTLDRFFIYSANTGSASEISFDGSNAAGMDFVLNKLKLPGLNLLSSSTTSGSSVGAIDPNQPLSSQFSGLPASFTLKLTNPNANGGAVQTIAVDTATNTLNDLMNAINASGSATASFDQALGKFTLTPTNGGTLDFSGSDGAALSFLSSSLKLSVARHNGKDAIFNLDGANGLTEASNTFTISGVTYNLLSEGSANINVASDVDTAVANIQSLVDAYNKILAELNGKVNEPRYPDYPPLTDAQKAAMKDSDITLWNQKAQSGMLHNDTTLTSLIYTLRNAFSSPVAGIAATTVNGTSVTYNNAASIGITTGDYTEGGKLYLDTNKLRAALQANPDALYQLFGATGQTTAGGKTVTDYQKQGIAGRLYDALKNTMDGLKQMAGTTASAQYDATSNIAKKMADYNRQISDEQARFTAIQSQYYSQYNAMELAIQQLNAQSSWFLSQFASK